MIDSKHQLEFSFLENEESERGITPMCCPRCHSFLGVFELTGHVLERAHFIHNRYVCFECLTAKEKAKVIVDYLRRI